MLKHRFVGRAGVILSMSVAWLLPTTAYALIEVSYGNDPVRSMGWPTGAEAVANLPSRLGFMGGPPFGGGEYYLLYHCQDTDEFNRALRQFGLIRSPRTARRSLVSLDGQHTWMTEEKALLMVVHDWTREPWPESRGKSGGQQPKRVDWTFTVWTPENFYQLFGGAEGNHFSSHPNFRQPVPAPRIDLYVGKDNPILWEDVEVPATVRVLDRRATKASVDGAVGGVVRGGVFDMATHQVIASADVVLSQRTDSRQWQEAARVKTNEAGSFEIQDLPAGYYSLEVHAEGYADRHVATYHNRSGHEDLDLDVLLVVLTYPQGQTDMVEPNTPYPLQAQLQAIGGDISEAIVRLHYSLDGGPVTDVIMDALGNDLYQADLP
ncbi:MAG: carboxypeptidase regulatory-like domain-containing protein, partial [Planctomycetes bacterium]|nr:carboxypeptidase regulatory-like domain-containing protein [Planctomycetota bacterium]